MESANKIIKTDFTQLPKHVHPEPDQDWVSVDFASGPREITILGYARNGDSRHHFSPSEINLVTSGSEEKLEVEMRITKDNDEFVVSGRDLYHYRLNIMFSEFVPTQCSVVHLDENEATQLEVLEAMLDDPDDYL